MGCGVFTGFERNKDRSPLSPCNLYGLDCTTPPTRNQLRNRNAPNQNPGSPVPGVHESNYCGQCNGTGYTGGNLSKKICWRCKGRGKI